MSRTAKMPVLAAYMVMSVLWIGVSCANSEDRPRDVFSLSKEELEAWYREVRPKAEAGDAQAQYWMGNFVLAGVDKVPYPTLADRERASLMWTKRSALQVYKLSMQALSNAYRNAWMNLERNSTLSTCWENAVRGEVAPQRCAELERRILGQD